MIKDFNKDLKLGETLSNVINKVYPQIFGQDISIENINFNDKKGKSYRLSGINKIIHLSNNEKIFINEKIHRKTDNIIIELWSDFNTGKLGWLFTSKAKYIVQIDLAQNKVCLLSLKSLKKYYTDLCKKYGGSINKIPNIKWQISKRDGPLKNWKSGHIEITEKQFLDWASKENIDTPKIYRLCLESEF